MRPKGVSVSGTAVSWNDTDNAEYRLYDGSTSDTDIKAEWKAGTYTKALTDTPVKGGITANSDGKRYDQTFSFSAVTPGSYKLAIFKPGKYVPKIVPITVDSTDYGCGELKLWLYGDVTYDGMVDTDDVIHLKRYINKKSSLLTIGTEEEKTEKLFVCDINGDGLVDTDDVVHYNRYINQKTSLFDNLK